MRPRQGNGYFAGSKARGFDPVSVASEVAPKASNNFDESRYQYDHGVNRHGPGAKRPPAGVSRPGRNRAPVRAPGPLTGAGRRGLPRTSASDALAGETLEAAA